MKKVFFTIALIAGMVSVNTLSAKELPAIKTILKQLDVLMDLKSDLSAKVNITEEKPNQGLKKIECFYYRSDTKDAFLIVMLAPASEKGNGYLSIGDNMWMYKQNTRTFQHISRDEAIGGSDVKSGDMEKRKLSVLYKGAVDAKTGKEMITEEKLGDIPVYKVELTAQVNDVSYPKKVYWVRQDNYLPMMEKSYSLSGTLMETIYYLKYTTIGGKYFCIKTRIDDEFDKGNKTLMEISGISLDKLDANIFTQGYLESLSK
ncbi:MAG: outer membrane lipoprotein-sorting protein [Brevinematales bacterium]|nr:outer membrane lipoprotein-sorting protein [Brevinematales bacterium]